MHLICVHKPEAKHTQTYLYFLECVCNAELCSVRSVCRCFVRDDTIYIVSDYNSFYISQYQNNT